MYNTKYEKEVEEMILKLDMKSNIPIYVQLRNEIVMGIGRGELAMGEGLPTVRQLAEDIGVNMMTVNKSYTTLKNEGYIEIDGRRGAKVNPSLERNKEFKEKVERDLELIIAESGLRGIEYKEFMKICQDIFSNMNGVRTLESEW